METTATKGRPEDIITLSVAPCISHGIGVEISRGCSLGCIYCFSGCAENKTPGNQVCYYYNAAEVLKQFLDQHGSDVRNVHLGYVTDFFQPDVQKIRVQVLRVLLDHPSQPNVSCLSKGRPDDQSIKLINQMTDRFTFMFDLGSFDTEWEPNVLDFWSRLEQVKKLKCNMGARLDPIIPGVTELGLIADHLHALQEANITDLDCSFLFLTDQVADSIERRFGPEYLDKMLEAYEEGSEEYLNGAVNWTGAEMKIDMEDIRYKIDTIALPSPDKSYRIRVIKHLKTMCKEFGITVRLCNCKNRTMKGMTDFCTDSRRLKEVKQYA